MAQNFEISGNILLGFSGQMVDENSRKFVRYSLHSVMYYWTSQNVYATHEICEQSKEMDLCIDTIFMYIQTHYTIKPYNIGIFVEIEVYLSVRV